MTAHLPISELQGAIYSRVYELYTAEIDARIQSLTQQKANSNLDAMLMFLGLQMEFNLHKKKGLSKEQRAEICRANGKKGGAPKGNKNRTKNALKKQAV